MWVEEYMKLPDGFLEKSGKVVKLECTLYGAKQAGRQWSAFFYKTLTCRQVWHGAEARECVKSCSVLIMASSPLKVAGSWSDSWSGL